ncbi:MAG: hypothetical protein HEP71_16760 [Roseivirga sp.]|nr:hypothetical protein [Roseivirga sp.]
MKHFFSICALVLVHGLQSQSTLTTGDVAFLAFNLDGSDEFSFVLLTDVDNGTVIKITDHGWDDTNGFGTPSGGGDGVLTWTASSNLTAGTVVSVTGSVTRTVNTGSISGTGVVLSLIGDQLFAYQGTFASPTFLAGMHSDEFAAVLSGATISTTNANWSGDDHADNETSALPDVLTTGVNAIRLYDPTQTSGSSAAEVDNWIYVGTTTTGTKTELLAAINDLDNWDSDNLTSFGTYSGTFTVNSSAPTSATIAATVFIEGAYNGTGLSTTLNAGLPLAQPYSNNGHAAGETAGAIPAGAVDWVLVELREAGSAAAALNATKVGSAAGFLMNDGSVKSTDGTSNLTVSLSGNTGADFFVVIYHRNHLPIMSANAISESSSLYTIDFTSSSATTYQTTSALVSLSGGKFGMPAGDADGDGDVDATDLTTWRTNNGVSFSYSGSGVADFNLDGVINAIDRNELHQKNLSKTSQVPGS